MSAAVTAAVVLAGFFALVYVVGLVGSYLGRVKPRRRERALDAALLKAQADFKLFVDKTGPSAWSQHDSADATD